MERTPTKAQAALALLSLLILVLVGMLWVHRWLAPASAESVAGVIVPSDQASAPPPPRSDVVAEAPPTSRTKCAILPGTPTENGVTVIAIDDVGRSVPATCVYRHHGRSRYLPEEATPIGRTDENGVWCARGPDAILGSGEEFLFHKEGLMPAALSAVEPGAQYSVVLSQGLTLEGRCVNRHGEPVAGVSVLLSRSSLPVALLDGRQAPRITPGARPSTAVYSCITSSSGAFLIGGLAAGIYGIEVQSRRLVVSRGMPQTRVVAVPRPESLTLVLEELQVCVLKLPGDSRMVTRNYGMPRGAVTDNVMAPGIKRARDDLSRQYPGTIVCVAVPEASWDGPLVAEIEAFITGHGWCDIRAPLRLISRFSSPDLLELGALGDKAPTGSITVRIEDLLGRPCDPEQFYLEKGQSAREGGQRGAGTERRVVATVKGSEMTLPVGEYRLRAWSTMLDPMIGKQIVRVRVDTSTDVVARLKVSLVSVAVGVRLPDGETPAAMQCAILKDGRIVSNVSVKGAASWNGLLPEGSYTVRIQCAGLETVEKAVALVPGVSKQEFWFDASYRD